MFSPRCPCPCIAMECRTCHTRAFLLSDPHSPVSVTGQPLAQHPHHGGDCTGDMEGRGHGRSFRQDAEAEGPAGRSAQLPPCSRLQGLLLRPAHGSRGQDLPGEGDRDHLPQDGEDHLVQRPPGAKRLRQRGPCLCSAEQQDRRVCRAGEHHCR